MSFPGSILLDQGDIYQCYADSRDRPLGTRGYTLDGRAFRWARAGASALAAGMMVQAEAVNGDLNAQPIADSTDWAVPTTSTTIIHLSTATSMGTADFFKDGYFMVTAGTTSNDGQMVQIESCPKTTATAGAAYCPEIYLYPSDKLTSALTTSNTVSLIKNLYDDVIVTLDAAPTAPAIGVAPCAVTATYYFWLQTWGMACVRVSDTWDTGHYIVYASATGTREGEASPASSLETDKGAAIVGVAQYIGTDGHCGAAMITFAP